MQNYLKVQKILCNATNLLRKKGFFGFYFVYIIKERKISGKFAERRNVYDYS